VLRSGFGPDKSRTRSTSYTRQHRAAPAGEVGDVLRNNLAVLAVTLGIFALVTTEIVPVGLLTSIGATFGISDGTTGLLMTLPGFLAAVAAPVVTVATAHVDRRRMLAVFMLVLTAANVLAAVAPTYWIALVSRVLLGVTIGGFWSISAGLAERLVPPDRVTKAKTVVFSAVPLGSVLGVPAGTFLGDTMGWRMTFVALAVLAGVTLVALRALPPLPPIHVTHLEVLREALKPSRKALLVTFLIVLAHFATYTYIRPFLEPHLNANEITLLLLTYGTAGIIGNFVAGPLVARHPRATFAAAAAMIAAATLLLPVLDPVPLLILWGVAYGAVPVCSQTWFTKAAPGEAASVLFTASYQATLGFGAMVGGVVVDHTSPSTVMIFGGLTAALVVGVIGSERDRQTRDRSGVEAVHVLDP
jgi:predicted MFS family arabinose efflux permease